MVVVQVLAFGKVQDNRVERRERKAAKAERERSRKEQIECAGEFIGRKSGKTMNGGLDGVVDSIDESGDCYSRSIAYDGKAKLNGAAATRVGLFEKAAQTEGLEMESEASLTETSEEEMMI